MHRCIVWWAHGELHHRLLVLVINCLTLGSILFFCCCVLSQCKKKFFQTSCPSIVFIFCLGLHLAPFGYHCSFLFLCIIKWYLLFSPPAQFCSVVQFFGVRVVHNFSF
jgi:hypothetical protein